MNQDSGIIVSGAGIRSCQNISLKRLVHKTSTSEINLYLWMKLEQDYNGEEHQ